MRHSPTSTLFPYTTLFRSGDGADKVRHLLEQGGGRHPGSAGQGSCDLHRGAGSLHSVAGELFGHEGKSHGVLQGDGDRKSTRLNSSHMSISYAVFCLKKKN